MFFRFWTTENRYNCHNELSFRDCAVIAQRWYERVREHIDEGRDVAEYLAYDEAMLGEISSRNDSRLVALTTGSSDSRSIKVTDIERVSDAHAMELNNDLTYFLIVTQYRWPSSFKYIGKR